MATTIHDNVLGPIELEAPLLALVDHPAVQRLRRLEQLGTASLVFPGARHTRLAHSIGAQEIMRRVWRRLERMAAVMCSRKRMRRTTPSPPRCRPLPPLPRRMAKDSTRV